MSADLATRVAALTDEQLALATDNALADFGMADKYEHNAHLLPPIRTHLDALYAEQRTRDEAQRAARIAETARQQWRDALLGENPQHTEPRYGNVTVGELKRYGELCVALAAQEVGRARDEAFCRALISTLSMEQMAATLKAYHEYAGTQPKVAA